MFLNLAELPDGWIETTLGEVGNWSSGGTPSRKESKYYGGNIPWVKTGNLADGIILEIDEKITEEGLKNSSAKIFPGASLIVAMYGATIGKLGILKAPAATNQACAALLAQGVTKELIQFIFYYLLNSREALRKIGKGGAQPNISQTVIKEFPCALPPLNEQRRIVTKIEELTAHSRRAREALDDVPTLINQFRQSVLAAAFRGDLTADWREKNSDVKSASSYLKKIGIEPESPPDFLDLHKLPIGWNWASLGSIGDASGGLTKNSKRKELPLEYPYLRVANVHANRLDLDEIKTINIQEKELGRVLLKKGDLLVVEGNGSIDQIGRVALWDGSIDPCLHQNHLIKVRFSPIEVGKWVLPWLLSAQGRRYITRVASSTSGLHTLSISKVSAFPIPIAPEKEQKEIVKRINSFFTALSRVETLFTSSEDDLDFLDQSILAKAFRGDLVPQDPDDEPASVLLERIRAEREKLATTKKKGRTSRKKTI